MSAWSDKYVIGLTGNIASGKSVVRIMLEYLGADGIDADQLAHQAISMGSPGYNQVVDLFGIDFLTADGQIDRARLGERVFSNPADLSRLEAIVHPIVGQMIDKRIRHSTVDVVVIEAIKLIEANLHLQCDQVWVTWATPETQLTRLTTLRKMNKALALQRIASQPSQELKLSLADVIIRNDGSLANTWEQVLSAWIVTFPKRQLPPGDPIALLQ